MFSVIICTYNPDPTKWARVLEALKNQDFPSANWEWIVVDNASKLPVLTFIPEDLKTKIKIIDEKNPGLTNARINGINAATNEWLIFVDDDNMLAPNYLLQANKIIQNNSNIGAFGGKIIPEYETAPAPYIEPHVLMLAIRTPDSSFVGKEYDWPYTPFGAGMVIRRDIAQHYVMKLQNDPMRRGLDRKGDSLMSSGDIDMAHTAVDMGYDMGVFVDLSLTHIIPSNRVQHGYILNMMRYNILSNHLLFFIRFGRMPRLAPLSKRIKKHVDFWLKGEWFESLLFHKKNQGTRDAIRQILQLKQQAN